MKTISPEVHEALSSATIDGLAVHLNGTLDRKVYTEVNAVLEEAGGRWNRKAKAHIFQDDPTEKIKSMLSAGAYTQAKQEFGAFFTPEELAGKVIAEARLQTGDKVLEPSAGHGALASLAAQEVGIENVQCVEIQAQNCAALRSAGLQVLEADFLSLDERSLPQFERIVMNPPFAKQADIDHVTHALKFLKPEGILIAIMSASVEFRSNKKTKAFLDLIRSEPFSYGIDRNPEKSFASSGTGVNTVMIVIERQS